MNNIVFKDVSLFYENNKTYINVLNKLSLTFKEGKTSVIIGPTGAGKSTILKCITSQLLFEGNIFIGEQNIESIKVQDRNLSYMSQDIILYPKMIVYDNIAFALRNSKISRDEIDKRVKEIAKQFNIGLLLTRKVDQLSIGQQQKVALAKALIKKPSFLLLDEPFSSLDEESKASITILLKEYISKNKTGVILVTHDLKECFKLADYIYPIVDGKSLGEFTTKSILGIKDKTIIDMLKGIK